jgi:ATP-binding protein involved in chromosome partitioning
MITESELKKALEQVQDPGLKRDIVNLGMVRNIQITDHRVAFTLALTTLACPLKDQIVTNAKRAVLDLEGIQAVDIQIAEMTTKEKAALGSGESKKGRAEKLNNVKHVIAVMSGKGGVGKSLVAGLLATSLRRCGNRVGVLDADITGPSIPKMFFANDARAGFSPLAILPVKTNTGISVMSINLLLKSADEAVIWRGPLISTAIQQFWSDVLWGDVDYLLVDLPPGTSDAALTVLQSLPMSGVVLVTSPQSLAGMVVRKAVKMVRHIGIPTIGLLENMSYFICPDTGKHHQIFGPSNPELMASMLGMPLLGCLPIDPTIAALCDRGEIEQYSGDFFNPISKRIAQLTPVASMPTSRK